jgi:hypothetical protein
MAATSIKDGFQGGSDNQLKVNSDGSVNVNSTGAGGGPVVTNITEIGGATISEGQKPMSASLPVVIASDQTPMVSTTAVVTSVTSSATNTTLLASNPNRKGAVFYNDSTQTCYLKLGTSASNTSFTILMQTGSTFIIDTPPLYTGGVDGIWSSANGFMRVTELV